MEQQLSFLGLIALHDPPRPNVERSIAQATAAGIRTILISGDHPRTAIAIARQLGITQKPDALTGDEMDQLSDGQLAHRLARQSILARVNPQQKLRAAQVLQHSGEVVAMTGDGVNDAPALQAADIGISMGSGTEIAKEASDIILTDDNFSTIVEAIRQGRILSANIRKTVTYLLSTNLCEVLTLFAAAVVSIFSMRRTVGNLSLPLTTLQILWVNLITDTAPALALALSPARENVMGKPVGQDAGDILSRSRYVEIVLNSVVMATAVLAVYFNAADSPIEVRRSLTLTTLILAQAFYSVTLHSETVSLVRYIASLSGLGISVLATTTLHLALLSSAPLSRIFGVTRLSSRQWMLCAVFASSVLVVNELRKMLRRWNTGPTQASKEETVHAQGAH